MSDPSSHPWLVLLVIVAVIALCSGVSNALARRGRARRVAEQERRHLREWAEESEAFHAAGARHEADVKSLAFGGKENEIDRSIDRAADDTLRRWGARLESTTCADVEERSARLRADRVPADLVVGDLDVISTTLRRKLADDRATRKCDQVAFVVSDPTCHLILSLDQGYARKNVYVLWRVGDEFALAEQYGSIPQPDDADRSPR